MRLSATPLGSFEAGLSRFGCPYRGSCRVLIVLTRDNQYYRGWLAADQPGKGGFPRVWRKAQTLLVDAVKAEADGNRGPAIPVRIAPDADDAPLEADVVAQFFRDHAPRAAPGLGWKGLKFGRQRADMSREQAVDSFEDRHGALCRWLV